MKMFSLHQLTVFKLSFMLSKQTWHRVKLNYEITFFSVLSFTLKPKLANRNVLALPSE